MNAKTININGQLISFNTPKIMGILNVTPDSFFSKTNIEEKGLIDHVLQMLNDGVDIIDIGGQSTNPNSPFLTEDQEWERINRSLKIIRKEFPDILLSVDTFYSGIAERAVGDFGVNMINDISGGSIDKQMFQTIAKINVPYILMHMKGTPQTMQSETEYSNFIQEIFFYFSKKITQLNQLGVSDIILDPGFGFAKNLEQNYELMGALRGFEIFDVPVLVGISRKSMIYKLLGIDPQDSISGTIALNAYALMNGANILRVHDVKEAKELITIFEKINEKAL